MEIGTSWVQGYLSPPSQPLSSLPHLEECLLFAGKVLSDVLLPAVVHLLLHHITVIEEVEQTQQKTCRQHTHLSVNAYSCTNAHKWQAGRHACQHIHTAHSGTKQTTTHMHGTTNAHTYVHTYMVCTYGYYCNSNVHTNKHLHTHTYRHTGGTTQDDQANIITIYETSVYSTPQGTFPGEPPTHS